MRASIIPAGYTDTHTLLLESLRGRFALNPQHIARANEKKKGSLTI